MKSVVSILIGMCLVAQCMLQLGIVGWYEINKSYISANLCENKDKPELQCHGKCYLKKQLKKTGQHQEGTNPAQGKENIQFVYFILPDAWQSRLGQDISVLHHYAQYNMPATTSPLADIFHPPPYSA